MDEALVLYAVVAMGSAALSAGIMAALLRTRWTTTLIDRPNERSLHDRPIPRIGGIAVHGATFVVSVAAFALFPVQLRDAVLLATISGSAACLFAFSLSDDRRSLSIRSRLLVQIVATLAVTSVALRAGAGLSQAVVALCAALSLVWMTNAYNFMDGSNGLAAGMSLIGFSTYALLAVREHDEGLALICLALAGASLGFLRFNFGAARAFLGDCGSIPLGFFAGSFGLYGWATGVWRWWTAAIVFLPFVADATVTLVRRALQGKKFWLPHREHAYQRLVLVGWTHRRVALTSYVVMLACATFAIALQASEPAKQWLGIILIAFAMVAALIFIEYRYSKTHEQLLH